MAFIKKSQPEAGQPLAETENAFIDTSQKCQPKAGQPLAENAY